MELKDQIIKKLGLIPLPEEGGFYFESFRSKIEVEVDFMGNGVKEKKRASTCIYYLVTPEDFSALHKVKSDEVFHFYLGDPVEMFQVDDKGTRKILIGSDILNGETPQVIVPAGMWQGTRLKEGGKFALMGTTVSPGFEYVDFELASREEMLKMFPSQREDIIRYTRD